MNIEALTQESESQSRSKSRIQSESMPSTAAASDSTDTRMKGELWNEVKMLTFTRDDEGRGTGLERVSSPYFFSFLCHNDAA